MHNLYLHSNKSIKRHESMSLQCYCNKSIIDVPWKRVSPDLQSAQTYELQHPGLTHAARGRFSIPLTGQRAPPK